ncbi:hypothetical protein BJ973_002688 [Actinoplanes tereljensis]|uniref:Uncharacterized protein n=1 Tax=Paractinoplanes tereljensis TaxID=571912 RepID=A0A919NNY6_9ACTN|nr:hypothetical protein [Actinoplanes tereljensis]GIF22366.1 hypothetical protein Ate02nite_50960 [Actinoplanes tereljensis]
MSDGEFHVYVGLLAFSGLALAVLAVRGFDQRGFTRVIDGLFAVAFLGYAALLAVADPAPEVSRGFYGLMAVPVVLVLHMRRQQRRVRASRFAAGFTPEAYGPKTAPTPLTPFPAPPPPLSSGGAEDGSAERGSDAPPRSGLSGLSNLPPPTLPPTKWVAPTPGSRPPMPSGLPAAAPAVGPPANLPGVLHGLNPPPPPPDPHPPLGAPAGPARAIEPARPPAAQPESPAAPPPGEPGGSPVPGWHQPGRHEGTAGRHESAEQPGYNTPYGRHGDYSAADRYSNYDPGEQFGTYQPTGSGEAWNQGGYAGHDTHAGGDNHAENAHLYETSSRLRQPAWLSSYPADDAQPEADDEPEENGRHSRGGPPGPPQQPGDWPPRPG